MVQVAYGMTINRSQSQTLQAVGIYLPKPVFAHGHLYVACSRVGKQNQLKVFVDHDKPHFDDESLNNDNDTYTENVVYQSVIMRCSK